MPRVSLPLPVACCCGFLCASSVQASEGDAPATDVCVVGDAPAAVDALVAALRVRGLDASACDPATAPSWTVAATGLSDGPVTVVVRCADGRTWKPPVTLEDSSRPEDRARAVAVEVTPVLHLLFEGLEPSLPPEPPPVEPPEPPEPPAPPVGVVEGFVITVESAPAPAEGPGEEPTPSGSTTDESPAGHDGDAPAVVWSLALLVGAAGNLESGDARRGLGVAVGVRADVTLPMGAWLALEFDWTVADEQREETYLLETGTPRLLAGVAVGPGPWSVRFGLGWAVQGWWTAGGAAPRGWRMGGVLLIAPAWQPLEWLGIGADFAVELYRTRVEVDWGPEPLFALDHWRWRAGGWVAFSLGKN